MKKKYLFKNKPEELKTLVEDYVEHENPLVMFDPAFGPTPPYYEFHPCVAGVKTFYLSFEGNVYPCTALLNERFAVGNIHDQSLFELWDDPAMIAVASLTRRHITGRCRDCEHFRGCRGACRGTAYAHTGDLFGSSPICLYQIAADRSEILSK